MKNLPSKFILTRKPKEYLKQGLTHYGVYSLKEILSACGKDNKRHPREYHTNWVGRNLFSFVIIPSLILVLFTTLPSFANGGDQRVVEGKYFINLSRSPFTPKARDNVALIASFVDIQTGKLIGEDLIVKVRIAKLGEGRNNREFLFEQENLIAKGGILEFQYTFRDSGLHEIFFDFAFASNPQKIYTAPDFLLDIQKPEVQQNSNSPLFIGIGLGVIVGFIAGWLVRRKNIEKS